jgi:hypothetical protein
MLPLPAGIEKLTRSIESMSVLCGPSAAMLAVDISIAAAMIHADFRACSLNSDPPYRPERFSILMPSRLCSLHCDMIPVVFSAFHAGRKCTGS